MKNLLKTIGITLGTILLLILIVAGTTLFLMHRPSSLTASMTPIVSTHEAAVVLENKLTDFENSVQNATPGTQVSLNVSQEEITSKVNEELAGMTDKLPAGMTISNVSINFQDGKALISAPLKYSALSGTAGAQIAVNTVDGRPTVQIQEIDFGALPIPQAVKDQLIGLIPNNGTIDMGNIPVDITQIQIINGQIVMNGVTR